MSKVGHLCIKCRIPLVVESDSIKHNLMYDKSCWNCKEVMQITRNAKGKREYWYKNKRVTN